MYIVFCFHEHGKRKRILVIKYSRFMWQTARVGNAKCLVRRKRNELRGKFLELD